MNKAQAMEAEANKDHILLVARQLGESNKKISRLDGRLDALLLVIFGGLISALVILAINIST